MYAYKEDIKKRIPKELQEFPEFNMLVSLVDDNKIRNVFELKGYLDREMEEIRKFFKEHKEVTGTAGTVDTKRRAKAVRIDFLNKLKTLYLKHLI